MGLRSSPKTVLCVVLSAFIVTSVNFAQSPGTALSAEAVVNATVAGIQDHAVVARDADGDSVVAWVGPDADGTGIYFRTYSYAGALGTETPANTTTALDQANPAVAMDTSGRFVVAWESNTGATNDKEIIATLYAADGTAIKPNIAVNGGQTGDETEPAVAMSNTGFVITWQGVDDVDSTSLDIFAQRFDTNGDAVGGPIAVNTTTANSQGSPSIGMAADGSFVIAWDSASQDGSSRGIYAQRFASNGTPVGTTEFRANTATAGDQSDASVGMGGGGGFVIAWQGPGASGTDIFAQPYDSTGAAVGTNLSVNDQTNGEQTAPEAAVDYDGDFVVAWQGPDLTLGLSNDAYLRRYSSAGTAQAGQAAVHAADAVTDQQRPDLALDADGDYVVVWESDADGDFDVYARRFVGPEDVDVGIVKADTTDPVATDADYTYTLTVTNHHAVGATGVGQARGIVVTDTMPTGATGTGSGTNWSCVNSGTTTITITCTYAADAGLAAGASSVITIAAHSPTTAPDPITNPQAEIQNDVTIDSHQNDTNTANDSDSELTAQCDDADAGKLQFSGATFSAAESGSATITVTRADGDGDGSAGTCGQVTVTYRTANDGTITATSAIAGTDYTAITGGTLTIDNGDSSGTFSVTLANDTIDEADETFHVVLENPVTRATLGIPVDATVTITDNDTATMDLVLSPTSQAEDSASTVTATVNLSTTVYRDVVANVACSGGTAETGDYACPATITVTAGQTSGSGTLDPNADTTDEVNETFNVAVTSAQLAGTDTATFTITDDDAAPNLTVADVTVTETDAVGLAATFVVTLSAASEKTVTVDYATSNGSADGNDYTAVSGSCTDGPPTSLVFTPGDTTKNIAVNITGDTLDENDTETFTFTLTEPDTLLCSSTPLNATITDATGTGTINDNDPLPEVTLTVNGSVSRTMTEAGAGAAAQAVIRATATPASGRAIIVPLTFETGSDTPNRGDSCSPGAVDFCSGTSITIPASSTSGGSAFAEITATSNADTRFEGIESATVDMDCATAPCIESGMLQQIELTITDDEPEPSFQFSSASSSANENAGAATITVQRDLSTATEVERTMTVAYTTGGTATNPADYTLAPASPLSFAPADASKTLTVTLVNDPNNEANETVVLTLQDPTPGTLGANNQHTLTIQNDDTLPQVMFESASSSAPEEQPISGAPTTAALRVKLSRADSSNDTVVPFSITTGMANAASASDYGTFTCKSQNGSEGACGGSAVTINAGDTFADILIPVTSDNIDESDETVTVALGTPSSNVTLVAPTSHTLTITDNDSATYTINDPAAVLEGNTGTKTITFTVTRTPSDHATTVDWATANNTATATASPPLPPAGDYEPGGATLNFAVDTSNSTQTFTVTVNGDTADESDETFFANLSAASAGTTIGDAQGVGTITDDDVSMSVADATVAEGTGAGTTTLDFVVTLNSPAVGTVTVNYATSDGTALQPGDYASASGMLTFNTGETSKTVPVTVVRDDVDESDETLTLTLSGASTGTTVTDGSATGTITDDDTAGYTIDDVTVTEGDAGTVTASFTVTRTASAAATTVDFTTVGVSATEGTDYADATGTLNFAASATSSTQTISVTVNGDLVDEADETYNVDLSNASAGTIADNQGVGTITDDDTSYTINDVTVTEGNSGSLTASFTVTRTASAVATTIDYTTVGVSATEGTDYADATGTLNFAASATSSTQTISVTVNGDLVDEADETYNVDLSNASAGTIADSQGLGTITDNDTASYTINDVTVTEGNSGSLTASFTVTRTASAVATTVNYTTVGVSATEGTDYADATGTLNFAASATSSTQTISVTVNGDLVDEANETYNVNLSNASAGTIADSQGVGTITDNDTAGLTVTQSSGSTAVAEGGATDTFTVVLNSQPTASVTITLNGGSQLGVSPASLTFTTANFSTPQTVTVTATNDTSVEGAHSGTVSASAASSDPGYNGRTATVTVSITDNDSVAAGDGAPIVVVTQTGGSTNVATSGGGGGAFSWTGLLALMGALGLRRRRALAAMLAMLAALPVSAAPSLSYSYADLRYVAVEVDDPDVDAGGFSLAGSWLIDPRFFLSASYASAETDDFVVQGVRGSSSADTLSLGAGVRRALTGKMAGTDASASFSLLSAKAEGQGGFRGSDDDVGFGLEAGLRGFLSPVFEWGAAVSYVSVFGDNSTSANVQWLYRLNPSFGAVAGAGLGDNSSHFNLGLRYNFARPAAKTR